MVFGSKSAASSDVKHDHGSPPAVEGRRKKRHCARFWWIYLIVFLLIALIVVLCVIFVAVPRIAQHDVDDSRLEFTELKFLDPTPNSISLSQESILYNPSKFTPTLDSFNASFFLVTNGTVAASRMLYITLPKIEASRPSSNQSIVSQTVLIENEEQLADFATQVLKNENVTTRLEGRTKLHLGGLPTNNVNYGETTTYKGLNGLKGFNVTGARVNLTAAAGQPNLKGFAYIPNPSVMTIAMGNVTLNVATEKAGLVGTTTILDMTLAPGNNTLPMFGTLNQTALLASMNQQTGIVDLIITGKEAIYREQHLTYYEKALASNNLILPMNVKQVVADSIAAAAGGRSG